MWIDCYRVQGYAAGHLGYLLLNPESEPGFDVNYKILLTKHTVFSLITIFYNIRFFK